MKKTDRENKHNFARILSASLALMLAFSVYTPVFASTVEPDSYDQNAVLNENSAQLDLEEQQGSQDEDNNETPGAGDEDKNETPNSGDEDGTEPEDCDHQWSDWETVKSATYFSAGSKARTCPLCQETETAEIAKKVAYSKWITENGKKYYMNSKGVPVKNWNKLYLNNSKTGSRKWCYFTSTGVYKKYVSGTTKSKWVWVGSRKFYFNRYSKPVGRGFHFIGGKLYYMGKYKYVLKGKFKAADGHTYTANNKGEIYGLIYYKYKYKSFILVDLSEQKLYLYKNKKRIMKTSVVTGNRGSHDTPTGIYKVGNKGRGVWLAGPSWGVRVKYWIPFIGGAYGFHDASWRPSGDFNSSSTYRGNGSHGCVNMRTSAAGTLYGKCYKGMTVIIRK